MSSEGPWPVHPYNDRCRWCSSPRVRFPTPSPTSAGSNQGVRIVAICPKCDCQTATVHGTGQQPQSFIFAPPIMAEYFRTGVRPAVEGA